MTQRERRFAHGISSRHPGRLSITKSASRQRNIGHCWRVCEDSSRRAQIISAARRIAEREGWSNVTVRRLSDEISYSQPVLYAHFESREGILAAVAIEGFQELGLALEKARKRVKLDTLRADGRPRAQWSRVKALPSWFESEISVTALHASAARHAPAGNNPIQATEDNLLNGARLYRDKCADCHGRPDNPLSDYGTSFFPPAPQFMEVHPRLRDRENFYIVKNGVRRSAMPAWGNIMADSEIWQVVLFLSHLNHLPPAVGRELHKPALSSP